MRRPRFSPAALAAAGFIVWACGGTGPQAAPSSSGFGDGFMGNGLQCGAILCSGSQQCCLVPVAVDASSSLPTHKCDQGCESQCMDSCPDAGSDMPGMGGKPSTTGMPTSGMPGTGQGGMDAMAGMDAKGGMGMGGTGGMGGMDAAPPGAPDAGDPDGATRP